MCRFGTALPRLAVAACVACQMSSVSAASQEIIVPIFGEDATVLQSYISTVTQGYPTATAIVVDFGIGCRSVKRDANLAAAIVSAQASGLQVFGYIPSRFACAVVGNCGGSACDAVQHDTTSMESYVRDWYRWYGVNGIFFDEGLKSATTNVHDFYQTLHDYIKTVNTQGVNGRTVILNMSGYQQDYRIFSTADIVLIWEGACSEFLNASWQPHYSEPPDSFFGSSRIQMGPHSVA